MLYRVCLSILFLAAGVSAVDGGTGSARLDSMRSASEARLREGRPKEAVSILKSVVSDPGARGEDHVRLGLAYLAAGNRKRARKAFEQAIDLGVEAAGHNGLGLVYRSMKNRGLKALYHFRRALAADPTFVEAQYNLAYGYETLRPLEALEAYEKVVEMNPRYPDAYYRIGRLLEKDDDRGGAMGAYRRQIAVYPAHGEARYRLGKLLYEKGEKRKAAVVFGELMTVDGDVEARAYVEMAVLSQNAREFENAQRLFERYIEELPEKEQRLYRDISLVATREELELYKGASEFEQEEMTRRFWNRQDPAPLSRANERQLEHYRRVAYARERFSRGEFPWDDRGEVYIRLGHPDHISRSDDIKGELDPYIRDARINFVTRLYGGYSVTPGLPIFPVRNDVRWEYWVYAGIDGGTEITFVSEFSNGKYVFAPFPRGLSGPAMMDLLKIQGELVLKGVTAREPSIYRADFADLPIDFYYYPAGFRGPEGKTRLEIYYGLPASEITRLQVDEKTDLLVLERGVALYDSLWNEIHRVEDQIAFQAPTERQVLDGAFIPGVLRVDLQPGPYRMALQIRDVLSGKSQVYKQEIVLEDYRGAEALKLSDIELAFSIYPADEEGPYVKEGMTVIPMSSRSFREGQHAFVYFEIYNLNRDEFGQSRYRVDYTFRSYEERSVPVRIFRGLGRLLRLVEKGREVVITYEQTGDRADEVAYVELDLTESKPGGQQVRVTVTDLLTGVEATRDITFKIVP